jgi:serine/threonine protein kinase
MHEMLDQTDRVLELLVEWDEQRQAGRALSAAELCPDDPALQAELRERIERRQRMLAVFEMPTLGDDGLAPASQPSANPLPLVAGYELFEVIGYGGMGVVYKARQLRLNRLVALKMVLAGANASPQDLARFRAEAEAVAQLQHPNIVQIFEVGEQNGCPYLALEHVSGGSLAQHLDGTPLAPRQAAEMLLALARAVQHAHEKGIVHRDLKPANVLLQPDGTPKITDFGLAKRLAAEQSHTMTGAILGSPSYMAPEQAAGQGDQVGPATDVYALGTILYELLTGRAPFKGATLMETIEQVREHDPVPPRFLQPKTPRDLETICLKCLEKSPRRRYESAAALAADLHAYLHEEPISAHSLTLFDQVARSITHHTFDARFRGFANRMAIIAPLPLLIHLVAFAFFAGKPYYAVAMVATTSVMIFTLVPALLLSGMPTLGVIPTWQRRHFVTVWIGHLLAMGFILLAVVLSLPADHWNGILIVYSLWAATAALSFLAHATEAGIYYMVAAVLFGASILMALTPGWAPLEIALLMTGNMTVQAIYLRGLTAERHTPASGPLGPKATTIKSVRH